MELKRLTGIQPYGMRHHYLRSSPDLLARELSEAGLIYDTSIGWATVPGFRASTPFPYRLWNAEARREGGWEIPLIVMDRSLGAFHDLDEEDAYQRGIAVLNRVAAAGGACAILWHPGSHHQMLAPGYARVYIRLLTWIAENGGFAGSVSDALERWLRRTTSLGVTPPADAKDAVDVHPSTETAL